MRLTRKKADVGYLKCYLRISASCYFCDDSKCAATTTTQSEEQILSLRTTSITSLLRKPWENYLVLAAIGRHVLSIGCNCPDLQCIVYAEAKSVTQC